MLTAVPLELPPFLAPLRKKLLTHPLHTRLQTLSDVVLFMEHHVFAVWDFMSLLKALQRRLTCIEVPWVPVGDRRIRRLVNEIVLAEESDTTPAGMPGSHFELYLEAMQEAGADTGPVERFIGHLGQRRGVAEALGRADVPQCVSDFVQGTFVVIENGQPHEIAAAFTYGREDLIPAMFLELVRGLEKAVPGRLSQLRYYLDRHILLDGDEHGDMGRSMVTLLCEGKPDRVAQAETAAATALKSRLRLWDGIAARLGDGAPPA
jgi:hypothetical protein